MTGPHPSVPVGPSFAAPLSFAYCSSGGLKGYTLTLGEAHAACERTATGTLQWLPVPGESPAFGTVARDSETGVLYYASPLPG